eukprot:scaffold41371_cov12-Tisochrysis_lutea.AAC.1
MTVFPPCQTIPAYSNTAESSEAGMALSSHCKWRDRTPRCLTRHVFDLDLENIRNLLESDEFEPAVAGTSIKRQFRHQSVEQ